MRKILLFFVITIAWTGVARADLPLNNEAPKKDTEMKLLLDKLVERGIISKEDADEVTKTDRTRRPDPRAGRGLPTPRPWLPDDNLIPPLGQQGPWQADPDRRFIIYGDIRLRHEYDNFEQNDFHRARYRYRLRIGVDTQFSESWRGSFGLVSGMMSGGAANPEQHRVGDYFPGTGNISMDAFNRLPTMINFGYMQYAPNNYFSLSMGKLKQGLQMWAPSQLIWRYDVNPDGLAMNFKTNRDAPWNFFAFTSLLALGEYRSNPPGWIVNDPLLDPGNGRMPIVALAQVGTHYEHGNNVARIALSVQQYEMRGTLIRSNSEQWFGGTMIQPANFTLINPSWDIRFRNSVLDRYMINFYGDYSYNANSANALDGMIPGVLNTYALDGEPRNHRHAFLFGFIFGDEHLDRAWNWFFRFEYYHVDPHALPIGFGNPNTLLHGRLDNGMMGWQGRGTRYNFNHALSHNFSMHWNYYRTQDNWAAIHRMEHRYQLDLLFRF